MRWKEKVKGRRTSCDMARTLGSIMGGIGGIMGIGYPAGSAGVNCLLGGDSRNLHEPAQDELERGQWKGAHWEMGDGKADLRAVVRMPRGR